MSSTAWRFATIPRMAIRYHNQLMSRNPSKKQTYPSDEADKFVLRFQPGSAMRTRLAEAAKANGRSMNAELLHRLDSSFSPQGSVHELRLKLSTPLREALFDVIDAISEVRRNLGMSFDAIRIDFSPYREEDFLAAMQRAESLASVDGDSAAAFLRSFLKTHRDASLFRHPPATREEALQALIEGSEVIEPKKPRRPAKSK